MSSENIAQTAEYGPQNTIESQILVLEELYADHNGTACPLQSTNEGVEYVAPSDLFPPAFVATHSQFDDWTALASSTQYALTDRDVLVSLPRETVDAVVDATTEFASASALVAAAVANLSHGAY
jgi:hypothetical protein